MSKSNNNKIYNSSSLFDKLADFIEEKFKIIIVLYLILVAFSPLIIGAIYLIPVDWELFSKDTAISYCGTLWGCFATIFVAFIAIYQNKKAQELELINAYQARQLDIVPFFDVEISVLSKMEFEISITNVSKNIATSIYFFEEELLPIVKPNQTQKVNFSINKESSTKMIVESNYIDFDEKGFPKEIWLSFSDVDDNILSQEFKLIDNGKYRMSSVSFDN